MTQTIQNSETHSRVEVKDFVPKNYDTEEMFMKTLSQDHLNARATFCIEKNLVKPSLTLVIENSASFKMYISRFIFTELAIQLFSPLQEDLWTILVVIVPQQAQDHKDSDCKGSNNFTMWQTPGQPARLISHPYRNICIDGRMITSRAWISIFPW